MGARTNLTDAEKEIIRRLFVEHGAPQRFIASVVGRHWRSVQNHTAKMHGERLVRLTQIAGEITEIYRRQE